VLAVACFDVEVDAVQDGGAQRTGAGLPAEEVVPDVVGDLGCVVGGAEGVAAAGAA